MALDSENHYTAYSAGIGVTQALFRADAFVALRVARTVADQAELRYELARQQLALRVAEAYFRVLQAEDAVTTFDAELRAIETQLQRARRAFELGAGTVTDVNDAQARLDGTVARRLAALNELRIAREALRRLIDAPVGRIAGLSPAFEPEVPQPADASEWAQAAEENNLQVLLAQTGLELARGEIARNRAARYPRVDLVGSIGRGYQGYAAQLPPGADATTDRASIGITVSMPLYTGGAINARVRQATALREASFHQLLNAKREAALGAESAYLTLVANLEQVRALEQALRSIRSTEESTQRGLELGLRTTLDLLNVQRERFQIERDLAGARYGYLLTYLRLQAAIGESLDEQAIAAVNRYLSAQ